jgi:hypothetical protein
MAETETRTKIFISYSRTDKAFASDLVLGLAACGFAPYIDREDIAAGEDWEKRLTGLIAEADTIVYVISPDSITSDHCSWELAESLRLAKRVLPVVWRSVEDVKTPAELKRLNYIFFSGEERTFAAGLSDLAQALRTDIGWIREHTRLAGLAQRWTARGRSEALLLRGDDLGAAAEWMAGKPMGAPPITDEQADFIKASSNAKVEAERRAARAKAGLLTAVSAAAVVFAGLAGIAAWQWWNAAAAEKKAVEANDGLRSANIRLGAEVWLRTAPSDAGYYVIDKGWYPVAANYSGAIARVERSGGGHPAYMSTGVLIDGGLVHPRYQGQPLLVLPAGVTPDLPAAPDAPSSGLPVQNESLPGDTRGFTEPAQPQHMATSDEIDDGPERLSVTFPVLGSQSAPFAGAEMVWRTPAQLGGEYPFQIWRLDKPPPFGWRAISREDIDCEAPDAAGGQRTIAILGVAVPAEGGASEQALALNISDMLDASVVQNILYTHSTNKASGGAPVFDLATGKIFAIHVASEPDPDRAGRRRGNGYSLPQLLNIARQSIEGAELGHLCES